MNPHSQGPFVIGGGGSRVGVRQGTTFITLAEVVEYDDDRDVILPMLANAYLFAAAPQMLQALRMASQGCPCTLSQRDSGHLVGCFVPDVQEAIGQAEGLS